MAGATAHHKGKTEQEGDIFHGENSTFAPANNGVTCGVTPSLASGLFKKAAKDRKINVETPARFCQEIFKRKANVPAIILRAGKSA
jgi:hypothetical protein